MEGVHVMATDTWGDNGQRLTDANFLTIGEIALIMRSTALPEGPSGSPQNPTRWSLLVQTACCNGSREGDGTPVAAPVVDRGSSCPG